MEVILLERIERLGQMGDVVNVKSGFGRNYLLPMGKALRSNKANLARFEAQRVQLEAQNLERKTEAESVAESMDGTKLIAIRQASEAGSLFGSVTSRDIAELATEGGFTVDRGQIVLDKPIKELGIHDVRVRLHPEVSANITVNVARSAEEAELQADGKTVAALRAEEEAEEALDVAALFEDMGKFDEDEDDVEAAPAEEASEEETK